MVEKDGEQPLLVRVADLACQIGLQRPVADIDGDALKLLGKSGPHEIADSADRRDRIGIVRQHGGDALLRDGEDPPDRAETGDELAGDARRVVAHDRCQDVFQERYGPKRRILRRWAIMPARNAIVCTHDGAWIST